MKRSLRKSWGLVMKVTKFLTGKTVTPVQSIEEARASVKNAWALIKSECLQVLGSELHYQGMIYHALRTESRIPVSKIGMNAKMWISNPVSELFRKLVSVKHQNYQEGFEPIPDVVIFKPDINSRDAMVGIKLNYNFIFDAANNQIASKYFTTKAI